MAIIKTFRTKAGALIEVDDSAIAGVPEEEMKKRKQRVLDVAREMAINNEIRRRLAEREALENAAK